MDDVKVWLNSPRNYDAGVKLYLQYGHDNLLKALFTREAETAFKRSRLETALKDLYQNHQHPTSPKAALQRQLQKQNPAENFKYWPPYPINDPIVSALYEQWKPLYSEMMNLQARLADVALLAEQDSNKALESCQMVHRILHLDDQCDDIYSKRDYYYQNGALPKLIIEEEVVGDPVRWVTNMRSAERYVRDYKAKLRKDPKNVKYAVKQKEHEEDVAKYRKLLKLD